MAPATAREPSSARPYFSGWPKWTSTTHQQTYHVWLERAWRGGLRTTTLFASHVESLCKTSLKSTREVSWPICEDSMRHIVDQLVVAREFERFIDFQNGGPGQGWFRIVTTPQQARDAVRAGKLAVVLGIEVDNLFNCKEAGCPADFGLPAARIASFGLSQPTTLEEAVAVIYDMGVRHVFPVHNFDNAFGAAATWMDPIGVGQAVAENRWWVTRNCGDNLGDYGFWIDNFIQSIMLILGFGVGETPAIPVYTNGNLEPAYASCNQYGLRPMGTQLIQALMNKGILIDVDHMSNLLARPDDCRDERRPRRQRRRLSSDGQPRAGLRSAPEGIRRQQGAARAHAHEGAPRRHPLERRHGRGDAERRCAGHRSEGRQVHEAVFARGGRGRLPTTAAIRARRGRSCCSTRWM